MNDGGSMVSPDVKPCVVICSRKVDQNGPRTGEEKRVAWVVKVKPGDGKIPIEKIYSEDGEIIEPHHVKFNSASEISFTSLTRDKEGRVVDSHVQNSIKFENLTGEGAFKGEGVFKGRHHLLGHFTDFSMIQIKPAALIERIAGHESYETIVGLALTVSERDSGEQEAAEDILGEQLWDGVPPVGKDRIVNGASKPPTHPVSHWEKIPLD